MSDGRRNRGFEQAGSPGAGALGLPEAAARRLRIAAAWERVAGAERAARLVATGVIRGVVELEGTAGAGEEPLLAALAGRLARACPELRIRRFRVMAPGESGRKPPSREIELPDGDDPGPQTHAADETRRPAARPEDPGEPDETRDQRLQRVMDLYLERCGDRS